MINSFKVKKRVLNVSYESLSKIDKTTWEFIQPLCENDLVYKTKEYVNWQLDNCQYLQTPIPKRNPYTSLLAGMRTNIHIYNLKITKNGAIIGFLSYIINYKEFNVKYFLVEDKKYYDLCVDVIIENFIEKRSTFIFTDDTRLSDTICKRYKTIFTHKVLKKGLAHNDTKLDFDNVNMLNRDGHFY